MPPKKAAAQGASKKNVEKAKAKVIEDKTFGLKNKKGKKQQVYIKTVSHQISQQGKDNKGTAGATKLSKREQEKQKLDELNALFKPVQQAQKVEDGVDPKSVLCNYFKLGTCQKGNKCKFSHDLAIERKSEKRSMYADERDTREETMNDWDQEKLEDVVNKKHAASNPSNTNIVCKYFLEAIEKSLYGWFWNCPNGAKCMYRHALPPGFVLQKDKKKAEDNEEKVSLEEHIENERNQLSGNLTPVTLETFLAWKKRKIQEKKDKLSKEMNQKKEAFKAGKSLMKISGKEVFLFKPELADNDDDEADDSFSNYQRQEGETEDEGPCVEINLEQFASTTSNDNSNSKITRVSTLCARDRETAGAPTSNSYENDYKNNNTSHTVEENGLLAEATGGGSEQAGVVIDESLFEDLDELDLED